MGTARWIDLPFTTPAEELLPPLVPRPSWPLEVEAQDPASPVGERASDEAKLASLPNVYLGAWVRLRF